MVTPITKQLDPFDDWETAYSRDEEVTEKSRNAKLWSEANSTAPTYSLQLSSASTSRLPPPTALLPGNLGNTMTILKRPSSAAADNARARSSDDPRKEKTLIEREKEYEEARRRIYGDETVEKKSSNGNGNANGNGKGRGRGGSGTLEESLVGLNLNSSNKRGGSSSRGRGKSSIEKTTTAAKIVVEGVIRAPRGPPDGGGFPSK